MYSVLANADKFLNWVIISAFSFHTAASATHCLQTPSCHSLNFPSLLGKKLRLLVLIMISVIVLFNG
ncbi:hypothetical protein Barb7_02513 [Bacteroidales bacterium Barb7]|nr:hypothetical protein Barb7_02513 [Bacteroidales bacterium Barb7]